MKKIENSLILNKDFDNLIELKFDFENINISELDLSLKDFDFSDIDELNIDLSSLEILDFNLSDSDFEFDLSEFGLEEGKELLNIWPLLQYQLYTTFSDLKKQRKWEQKSNQTRL